jgi:cytochrome c oxidase cbb3-type subunit 1
MENNALLSETGIIITLVLIVIPVIAALLIVIYKIYGIVNGLVRKRELEKFNEYLKGLSQEEVKQLEQRKRELEFALSNNELAGDIKLSDSRGLLASINSAEELRFVEKKKKSQPRPYIEPKLSRLILWYLGCAVFWLIFGTTVGEYVGIKFVAPDVDHISWLSFGRLRPVHTNAVFWGWASMAMMGLAYYVVPRISNAPLASIKTGYYTLVLINISVILGSITLMAGINNGGGEYREYIWPVMVLFGIGIILSIWNFIKTIARRSNKEIYVSNWYIISAMMFLLVIAVVAYWPGWQNGLGETIVQGYYMHQGIGM